MMAGEEFCLGAARGTGILMGGYLVKPVECQIRYLFCFKKIVEELREQKGKLSREKTRVQEEVNEARRHTRTRVIENYVKEWLTEAENALNDVQSLERRIEENAEFTRWCSRYRLSKEMDKKKEDIKKLVDRPSEFGRYGHPAEPMDLEFINEGYMASKSADKAFNEIMEALKNDEVNSIGVWGIGGVGKTTLVKEVGRNAKEQKLFGRIIKVVVSQTPDIGIIQDKIAEFLDFNFDKKTEEGKAEELWLRLKNEEKKKEEKVLIVLDDMCDKLDLKKIGIPLLGHGKGCTIILTTRNRSVCKSMKTQPTVPVDVLDEGDAWKLFKFKVNANLDSAASEIIEVAKEVVKECHGMPIAIVSLASALSTEDINGWKQAHHKLKSSRLMDIDKVPKEVDKNANLFLEKSVWELARALSCTIDLNGWELARALSSTIDLNGWELGRTKLESSRWVFLFIQTFISLLNQI